MNDYLIKYKISTVAELIRPFEFKGYELSSFTPEWWDCDAWVASKVINAKSANEARFEFINGLIPIVEKCSVVSQCAFRLIANSYIIYKQTNNSEGIVYVNFVRPVGYTGLHFDEDEIAQLPKLSSIPNQQAFMYIAEAANATTFYSRLAMLLSAVEALAGEIIHGKSVITNHEAIKEIIGIELHEQLYRYGTGLRNKLLHGNIVAHHLFDGLSDLVYEKIRAYLRKNYEIHMQDDVVHPQRNFHGNFQYLSTFMKLKSTSNLNLNDIEIAMDNDNPKHVEKEKELFSYYSNTPEDY